jgi:serine/threonine protein kinase
MTAPAERAKSVFLRAVEMESAEERRAYLDAACGEDAALRREVEELLNHHGELGGFLEAPPGTSAFEPDPAPAGGGAAPQGVGTVIGPYKLVQEIGEGGMGTVYLAQQTEPVKRLVALKVIKPGMDSRQVIARFEAERQALALMDHPNIAKVLDGGTTESGRPYFVMELVKGVPITRYCDEHRLTPRQRLELFVPVCQAVQHAHQKGIIHRDLKPSNVLVASYDGTPVPKVIDFGIAKATGPQLTERTLVTGLGAVVGTLEYMSPEQAELNQLDIDTRSDVYSLGVLLYELLTGTTPLERKRLKQAAMLEVLRVIREEEPPRPSTRLSTTEELPSIAANRGLEPKRLSGLVRGELDWIVMKALEKDRNRRYETANGFALDVQRYLHDEPVQACPPSAGYRFRKFARRNKGKLAVAAGLLVALAAVAGTVGWAVRDRAAREEEIARRLAARDQQAAHDQEVREAALDAEVGRILDEAGSLTERGKWPEALDAVQRADKLLAAAGRTERPPRLLALRKDLALVRRLEEINRAPEPAPARGLVVATGQGGQRGVLARQAAAEEEFYMGRAQDPLFAAAFRDFGIDIDALPAAEAAARIGRSTVRPALVQALDEWAALRRAGGDPDARWKKLVEVARRADGDAWRNQFRDASLRGDRPALEQLAAAIPFREVPPATLWLLGVELLELGAKDRAMAVLRQAQHQYPDETILAIPSAGAAGRNASRRATRTPSAIT